MPYNNGMVLTPKNIYFKQYKGLKYCETHKTMV